MVSLPSREHNFVLQQGAHLHLIPKPVLYVCAAMIALGVLPMPYGYYTYIRIVGFLVFSLCALESFYRREQLQPWAYGAAAILFNPFMKIHLPRDVWAILDLGAGALLLIAAQRNRR